jgi:hypothetical protein
MTFGDYESHVGNTFYLRTGHEPPVAVELIEAESLGPAPAESGLREPFSLIFRGPTDFRASQQVFRVEHEALPAAEIFMVPIGPDKHGNLYQAIFA